MSETLHEQLAERMDAKSLALTLELYGKSVAHTHSVTNWVMDQKDKEIAELKQYVIFLEDQIAAIQHRVLGLVRTDRYEGKIPYIEDDF
jgi:hypothetical protein